MPTPAYSRSCCRYCCRLWHNSSFVLNARTRDWQLYSDVTVRRKINSTFSTWYIWWCIKSTWFHVFPSQKSRIWISNSTQLFNTHNYPSAWAHLLLIQFTYVSLSCQSLKHCWLCPLFLMTLNRTYSATGTWHVPWIGIWRGAGQQKKRKKEHVTNLAIWLTVAQKVLFNLIESFWAVN